MKNKMKNKIDYVVRTAKCIYMDGRFINEGLSAPLYIRLEVIEKIKQLLKDDLMQTCEDRENGLFQEYAISGEWKKKNDN